MRRNFIACVVATSMLSGCVTLPPNSFAVTPEQLQQRQLETRRFSGINETDLIVASSNVLQDLGFTLDNSEVKLGVLTASKQRDATNAGEVAAAIFIALIGGGAMPISKDQTIRLSLVVRPVQGQDAQLSKDEHFVRVSFQRVVRRTDNSIAMETLKDQQLFQDFYDKLSKSVFLEAQKI